MDTEGEVLEKAVERSDSLKRTPKEKWAEPTGGLDAS
jgi:hypothetical protein